MIDERRPIFDYFHSDGGYVLGDNPVEEGAIWDVARESTTQIIQARERKDRLHIIDQQTTAQNIDFLRRSDFVPMIPCSSAIQAIHAAEALNQIRDGRFVQAIFSLATLPV